MILRDWIMQASPTVGKAVRNLKNSILCRSNTRRDRRTEDAAFIVIMAALTKVGRREMVRSEVSY
jgi:hypothetical protein